MLGAIIGDIAGSRFEFDPTNDYNFEFLSPEGDYTDDSICTVAVADAILRDRDFGESIHDWCRKYPYPMGGYGGRFAMWVRSNNPRPYGSYGNGSSMRVSPVGWLEQSRGLMLRMAEKTAECTHNDPEGIKGAQTVALAIHTALELRKGTNKLGEKEIDYIIGKCTEFSGYNVEIRKEDVINKFDETCQGTVPVALWIIGESTDFEDAVRKAVSLGADADTLGAIVGSIAEAIWGIPTEMMLEALKYLPDDMKNVVLHFYLRYGIDSRFCDLIDEDELDDYYDDETDEEDELDADEVNEELEKSYSFLDRDDDRQQLARKKDTKPKDSFAERKAREDKEKQDGTYSKRLIKDFIQEKLGGDMGKLADFDFGTLREDEEYGDCKGYAFSVDKCNIVKAIMSIVFADVWPELNQYNIEYYLFYCSQINYTQDLFGQNMLEMYFKGMKKFNPTQAQHQRALKVYHLTEYIGNIWVIPSGLERFRNTKHYNGYADEFIKRLYSAMTEKISGESKKPFDEAKKYLTNYKGDEGFTKLAKALMLDAYMDYYGKPIDLFMHVWSMMKDLKTETYFKAVDEYCTFMEEFVPKRGQMIVEKLKKVL